MSLVAVASNTVFRGRTILGRFNRLARRASAGWLDGVLLKP
jgi:hypothetical protein